METGGTEKLDPNDPKTIIAQAATGMDDEYNRRKGSEKTYYSIAHTVLEPVTEQPAMLVNGRLKEYQVCGSPLELLSVLATSCCLFLATLLFIIIILTSPLLFSLPPSLISSNFSSPSSSSFSPLLFTPSLLLFQLLFSVPSSTLYSSLLSSRSKGWSGLSPYTTTT